MKIAIASDVHLEFGDLLLKNEENADVLILSGDICVAKDIGAPDPHNFMEGARSNRFRDFFKRCSFQFPHVIFIMGNHEHYNGDFADSQAKLQTMLDQELLSNVHLLEKSSVTINDVIFVGGTLWSDMNREDPETLLQIARMMNDFQIIQNSHQRVSYKNLVPVYDETGTKKLDANLQPIMKAEFHSRPAKFTPHDALNDHKLCLAHIKEVIGSGTPDQKFVVVGHHAPSRLSTHPRYATDIIMNGGYSSSLDEFILNNPQIKLWTHGHTHEDFDYMIGSTRIVCNPRGYINYESRADTWSLKYVEV
jgi:predicted phosphodiesterase